MAKKDTPPVQSTPVGNGEPKTVSVEEVLQQVAALATQVQALTDKMSTPVASTPAPRNPAFIPPATASNGTHIPQEYVQMVHSILNQKFKIDIEFSPALPAFDFIVQVPKEYSNAPQPHWDMYGCDKRNRMIMNALGSEGVREYLNLIYNNLSMEARARITAERV